MMKKDVLLFGAKELSTALPKVEESMALAQEEQVSVLAAALRIRREAGVPMFTAQPAVSALAAAVAASINAGNMFVDAHRLFADLRSDLRIPESASGSPDGCPKPQFFTGAELPRVEVA
jgi:hypothetical protein